jgi:regulatory protein
LHAWLYYKDDNRYVPGRRLPSKLLDRNGLLAYAARTLASRAQSISEMREKLKRRAERSEDVDEVLAQLKLAGYLDDQRLAASAANWRRENEGLGKTRVLRDLMARRVAPAVAKQAAEDAFRGVDEVAMIENYLARKYRGKDLGSLLSEEKHLASAYRRLRAAGFSTGNSIRVLKRYAAEADRLEEEAERPEEFNA